MFAYLVNIVERFIGGDDLDQVGDGCFASWWSTVHGHIIHSILGRVSELPTQGGSRLQFKRNKRSVVSASSITISIWPRLVDKFTWGA